MMRSPTGCGGDLAALVHDHRDGWKRVVVDRSGLPFSRIRILQRLRRAPLTVKQVAAAATWTHPPRPSPSTTSKTGDSWSARPIRRIAGARWCR